MIITVHRSDRGLWALPCRRDDPPIVHWSEWFFVPLPAGFRDGRSFRKIRLKSVPYDISVPVGSQIVDKQRKDGTTIKRLITHFDKHGLDAETAFRLAQAGERGFRIATPGSVVLNVIRGE